MINEETEKSFEVLHETTCSVTPEIELLRRQIVVLCGQLVQEQPPGDWCNNSDDWAWVSREDRIMAWKRWSFNQAKGE
jgi:hypothetical protein